MSLLFGRTVGAVAWRVVLVLGGGAVVAAMVWAGVTAGGSPDPTVQHITPGAVVLDSGILVFREGLETILVLAAITASMVGGHAAHRRPVAAGAGLGFVASVITWFIVVAILSDVDAPELALQAATGLLAIVVLLVVMNWFFHKVYWTGWIGKHTQRRRRLFQLGGDARRQLLIGLVALGFTSFYREGFEVVLFLQSLRLQAGTTPVLGGVAIGLAFSAVVAGFTFVAHQRLPYKKMLVLTGALLAIVLVVMVGEEAQEMQLAGWISTTNLPLAIPDWVGLWFSIFPTVETLVAQAIAAVLVVGSYVLAEYVRVWRPRRVGERPAHRPEAAPEQSAI